MGEGIKKLYQDIGELWQRVKRVIMTKNSDVWINIAVAVICIFGIVMTGDASIGMASRQRVSTFFAPMNMIKQAVFVFLGWVLLLIIAKKVSIKKLMNQRFLLSSYFLLIFLMLLCRIWTINGAHAWIKMPGFTIQPAEFMKILLIIALAYYFAQVPYDFHRLGRHMSERGRVELNKQRMIYGVVIPFSMILLAFSICAIYQKDLGTALIIGAISYMLFCSAPDRMYKKMKALIPGAIVIFGALFILVIGFKTHQLARFNVWLHPLKDYNSTSYQTVNGLVGYVTGKLFGLGFTKSILKFGYIPEAQNDFISAIIVEEFGLVGFTIMMLLYCIIIFRLFYYAFRVRDDSERMILIGVASYYFFHLFINIGGVSGLIPMTGVPLLLISMGGSSTLAGLIGIGFCQNIIARYNTSMLSARASREL